MRSRSPVRHLTTGPGPSFARPSAESRPWIGGVASLGATEPGNASAERALSRALGPQAALLLEPSPSLVVDADNCTWDGRPVVTGDDWWRVIRAGALGRVEGSFALGWRAGSELCLARDPVGHRSLYYTEHRGVFAFASSLRALVEAGLTSGVLDPRSVAAYLAYAYVPGRATMVDGVFELLPGELLSWTFGALRRRAFWDLPAEPETFADEETLRGTLRSRLEATVRGALPAGAPVAASLSGGVDSSLIVALAQRFSPEPLATYSITFGAGHADELPFSSLVAEHCRTRHSIVELTPAAIVAHLDDTIACLGKPNGDPLTVPNALLFRTMAAEARVALNGEGGDPCFGGPKNLPMLLSVLYGHGQEQDRTAEAGDTGRGGALERTYLRAHLKCFDDLSEMLADDVLRAGCEPPLEDDLVPWFSDPRWHGLVSKLMAINTRFKGGHHILPKVSALSAPFGVSARSPLFAKELVELAFTLPPELKLRGSDEKYLLKRAVADLLPAAILERPKSGMMVPVEAWFQGPLLPEARGRLLEGLAPYRLLRPSYLERLVSGKLGGLRPRHGVKIWLLVTLEAHLRTHGLRPA